MLGLHISCVYKKERISVKEEEKNFRTRREKLCHRKDWKENRGLCLELMQIVTLRDNWQWMKYNGERRKEEGGKENDWRDEGRMHAFVSAVIRVWRACFSKEGLTGVVAGGLRVQIQRKWPRLISRRLDQIIISESVRVFPLTTREHNAAAAAVQ